MNSCLKQMITFCARPAMKRTGTVLAFVVIVIFSVLQLGSQTPQPTVTISAIPSWAQGGQITGFVSGTGVGQATLYLFAFIPDYGWSGLPGTCSPVTLQAGQFSINAAPSILFQYATRFTAYLVPATLSPQCGAISATVPFIITHNALSSASVPRLPQYSTLSFGGLDWYVKDAPVQVYPGPQFFIKDNAYVDSQGQLHLRITPCGGSWCAAEIYTQQTVGYGTYTFTINSELDNLDPNLALGLFSWDAQAGDQYNREWDLEFSRWGNPSATANAQYVVQPYDGPYNIQHFQMSPATPSTHVVSWGSSQVGFSSSTSIGNLISWWTYPGPIASVPTPGDVHLHLNYYVAAGTSPSVPVTQEVVISGFQYAPSGAEIGLTRVADSIPFQAQSYSVPLSATGATCAASVESDSPWLTVVGSNVVLAGGSLGYAVSDNFGSSRTGNLIVQSTNCNVTLGAQILAVTQAGLVCAPTFAAPSTSIGFLQSVFPVLIQGTASPCTWTVSTTSPWLQISSPSGAGNGSVQVTATANPGSNLRSDVLSLSNGPVHLVLQDGGGSLFALSPLNAASCTSQSAQFGLSWAAASNVEIHLNSPTGTLLGQFGPVGTTTFSGVTDGTVFYLIQAPDGSSPTVLASALASVLSFNCSSGSIAPLGLVNAASYAPNSVAPNSLATIFGSNLSSATAQASASPYPTSLGGVSVSLAGQLCPLWYVSPGQINFAVPPNIQSGRYTLTVGSAASDVLITNVSPGIFTLTSDGTGVPLAAITGVLGDGSTVSLPPYQCSASGCSVVPIALPTGLTDLYVVLYGTGIRNYKNISASLGPLPLDVLYAGAQSQYPGLDQVNLHLKGPMSLRSQQNLQLIVDGTNSNNVWLQFQ